MQTIPTLSEFETCEIDHVHPEGVWRARAALPDAEAASDLAALFGALGDPTRVRLLAALAVDPPKAAGEPNRGYADRVFLRLEEFGYVQRSREALDGRVVIVRATEIGANEGRVALARIELIERRIAMRAGKRAVAGTFAVLEASRSIRPPTRYD